MRKIENDMNTAIARRINWKFDNTSVVRGESLSSVFLHGNHIAVVHDNGEVDVNEATLSRWPTNTTVSRLRALGVNLTRQRGRMYLNGVEV